MVGDDPVEAARSSRREVRGSTNAFAESIDIFNQAPAEDNQSADGLISKTGAAYRRYMKASPTNLAGTSRFRANPFLFHGTHAVHDLRRCRGGVRKDPGGGSSLSLR